MRRKFLSLTPYFLVLGADFYLLPLLMRDTGSAMVLMLCVMPAIAFTAAVAAGICRGFTALLPLGAVILFIPTVFIHYNRSAWGYAVAYGLIVLAGTGAGGLFYRRR